MMRSSSWRNAWLGARVGALWRRRGSRRYWEREWARDNYAPPWLDRGVAREVAAAVEEGWFARTAPALDIGCGQGEIAAWLAERGFPATGIDIAESALARARARYGEHRGHLEFRRLDICSAAPARGRFAVLVDRGCFHQLPDADLPAYARNVAGASTSEARLLLFVKAFRGTPESAALGVAPHEAASASEDSREAVLARMDEASPERARHIARVESALGRDFVIERVAATFLDPHDGRDAAARLPGLVFRMQRRASEGGR